VASNWWLRHTVRARKNSRNRRCRHIGTPAARIEPIRHQQPAIDDLHREPQLVPRSSRQTLINQEPVLKQYDFVKLDNHLLVVDPMNSTVVAVIPRKFPKEQATQRGAPNGQTLDPASQGDEAETNKKN
jgi:hypothetical protein